MTKFLSLTFSIPRPEGDSENWVVRTILPQLGRMVHVPQVSYSHVGCQQTLVLALSCPFYLSYSYCYT